MAATEVIYFHLGTQLSPNLVFPPQVLLSLSRYSLPQLPFTIISYLLLPVSRGKKRRKPMQLRLFQRLAKPDQLDCRLNIGLKKGGLYP